MNKVKGVGGVARSLTCADARARGRVTQRKKKVEGKDKETHRQEKRSRGHKRKNRRQKKIREEKGECAKKGR